MAKILQRLAGNDRWWAAEFVLRSVGLALLGLCIGVSLFLYHSAHQRLEHEPRALEYAGALVVFLSWSSGGALLTVGPGLFERIALPGRYARFHVTKGQDR